MQSKSLALPVASNERVKKKHLFYQKNTARKYSAEGELTANSYGNTYVSTTINCTITRIAFIAVKKKWKSLNFVQ